MTTSSPLSDAALDGQSVGPSACRTCDPSLPTQPGEVIKTAAEWDASAYPAAGTPAPTFAARLAEALLCPECFRLRFSPMHLLTKWAHS